MLGELLGQYEVLAGFAALVAALVNAGKVIGWVKDGQAGNIALLLNVIGFIAYALLVQFKFDVEGLNLALAGVASVIVALLGMLGQFLITGVTHQALKKSGVSVFGKSYS